jgi:DNA-binding MarR family transcriptional regulator
VRLAAAVLSSPVRLHLIRYYTQNPGASMVDAAVALGTPSNSLGPNIRALVSAGVLTVSSSPVDHRANNYYVDRSRLIELVSAAQEFMLVPVTSSASTSSMVRS